MLRLETVATLLLLVSLFAAPKVAAQAVYSLGRNSNGELGRGSLGNLPTNSFKGATNIYGSYDTFLAKNSFFAPYFFGNNDYGQACLSSKYPIVGQTNFNSFSLDLVAVGRYHSLLTSASSPRGGYALIGCGRNNFNQSGAFASKLPYLPNAYYVNLTGVSTPLRALAVGDEHSLFIDGNYKLFGFGRSDSGQLNSTAIGFQTPALIQSAKSFTAISAASDYSLALDNLGNLYSFGKQILQRLGTDAEEGSIQSALTLVLTGVQAISASIFHAAALVSGGVVFTFGSNKFGQLGQGSPQNSSSLPLQVAGISNVIAVVAGVDHTICVTNDKKLWGFGSNEFRQLGSAANSTVYSPQQVGFTLDATMPPKVVAGYRVTLVVTNSQLWGFGDFSNQKFPLNTAPSPAVISTLDSMNVTAVAAGDAFSLAVVNGTVYSWGDNSFGQLGDDNSTVFRRTNPQPVQSLMDVTVTQISSGYYHSLALTSNGSVLIWGGAEYGSIPRELPVNSSFFVEAGPFTSFVVQRSGDILALGDNEFAQLGFSSATYVSQPTKLVLTGITGSCNKIAAGFNHTLFLFGSSVYSAGASPQFFSDVVNEGQDVVTDYSLTRIGNVGSTYIDIAVGAYFSLALASDGSLYKLGITSGTEEAPVIGDGGVITAIFGGGYSYVTVYSTGRAVGYGPNLNYELGTSLGVNGQQLPFRGSGMKFALRQHMLAVIQPFYCFGIKGTNTSACSGGTCTANDNCQCADMYSNKVLPDCSITDMNSGNFQLSAMPFGLFLAGTTRNITFYINTPINQLFVNGFRCKVNGATLPTRHVNTTVDKTYFQCEVTSSVAGTQDVRLDYNGVQIGSHVSISSVNRCNLQLYTDKWTGGTTNTYIKANVSTVIKFQCDGDEFFGQSIDVNRLYCKNSTNVISKCANTMNNGYNVICGCLLRPTDIGAVTVQLWYMNDDSSGSGGTELINLSTNFTMTAVDNAPITLLTPHFFQVGSTVQLSLYFPTEFPVVTGGLIGCKLDMQSTESRANSVMTSFNNVTKIMNCTVSTNYYYPTTLYVAAGNQANDDEIQMSSNRVDLIPFIKSDLTVDPVDLLGGATRLVNMKINPGITWAPITNANFIITYGARTIAAPSTFTIANQEMGVNVNLDFTAFPEIVAPVNVLLNSSLIPNYAVAVTNGAKTFRVWKPRTILKTLQRATIIPGTITVTYTLNETLTFKDNLYCFEYYGQATIASDNQTITCSYEYMNQLDYFDNQLQFQPQTVTLNVAKYVDYMYQFFSIAAKSVVAVAPSGWITGLSEDQAGQTLSIVVIFSIAPIPLNFMIKYPNGNVKALSCPANQCVIDSSLFTGLAVIPSPVKLAINTSTYNEELEVVDLFLSKPFLSTSTPIIASPELTTVQLEITPLGNVSLNPSYKFSCVVIARNQFYTAVVNSTSNKLTCFIPSTGVEESVDVSIYTNSKPIDAASLSTSKLVTTTKLEFKTLKLSQVAVDQDNPFTVYVNTASNVNYQLTANVTSNRFTLRLTFGSCSVDSANCTVNPNGTLSCPFTNLTSCVTSGVNLSDRGQLLMNDKVYAHLSSRMSTFKRSVITATSRVTCLQSVSCQLSITLLDPIIQLGNNLGGSNVTFMALVGNTSTSFIRLNNSVLTSAVSAPSLALTGVTPLSITLRFAFPNTPVEVHTLSLNSVNLMVIPRVNIQFRNYSQSYAIFDTGQPAIVDLSLPYVFPAGFNLNTLACYKIIGGAYSTSPTTLIGEIDGYVTIRCSVSQPNNGRVNVLIRQLEEDPSAAVQLPTLSLNNLTMIFAKPVPLLALDRSIIKSSQLVMTSLIMTVGFNATLGLGNDYKYFCVFSGAKVNYAVAQLAKSGGSGNTTANCTFVPSDVGVYDMSLSFGRQANESSAVTSNTLQLSIVGPYVIQPTYGLYSGGQNVTVNDFVGNVNSRMSVVDKWNVSYPEFTCHLSGFQQLKCKSPSLPAFKAFKLSIGDDPITTPYITYNVTKLAIGARAMNRQDAGGLAFAVTLTNQLQSDEGTFEICIGDSLCFPLGAVAPLSTLSTLSADSLAPSSYIARIAFVHPLATPAGLRISASNHVEFTVIDSVTALKYQAASPSIVSTNSQFITTVELAAYYSSSGASKMYSSIGNLQFLSSEKTANFITFKLTVPPSAIQWDVLNFNLKYQSQDEFGGTPVTASTSLSMMVVPSITIVSLTPSSSSSQSQLVTTTFDQLIPTVILDRVDMYCVMDDQRVILASAKTQSTVECTLTKDSQNVFNSVTVSISDKLSGSSYKHKLSSNAVNFSFMTALPIVNFTAVVESVNSMADVILQLNGSIPQQNLKCKYSVDGALYEAAGKAVSGDSVSCKLSFGAGAKEAQLVQVSVIITDGKSLNAQLSESHVDVFVIRKNSIVIGGQRLLDSTDNQVIDAPITMLFIPPTLNASLFTFDVIGVTAGDRFSYRDCSFSVTSNTTCKLPPVSVISSPQEIFTFLEVTSVQTRQKYLAPFGKNVILYEQQLIGKVAPFIISANETQGPSPAPRLIRVKMAANFQYVTGAKLLCQLENQFGTAQYVEAANDKNGVLCQVPALPANTNQLKVRVYLEDIQLSINHKTVQVLTFDQLPTFPSIIGQFGRVGPSLQIPTPPDLYSYDITSKFKGRTVVLANCTLGGNLLQCTPQRQMLPISITALTTLRMDELTSFNVPSPVNLYDDPKNFFDCDGKVNLVPSLFNVNGIQRNVTLSTCTMTNLPSFLARDAVHVKYTSHYNDGTTSEQVQQCSIATSALMNCGWPSQLTSAVDNVTVAISFDNLAFSDLRQVNTYNSTNLNLVNTSVTVIDSCLEYSSISIFGNFKDATIDSTRVRLVVGDITSVDAFVTRVDSTSLTVNLPAFPSTYDISTASGRFEVSIDGVLYLSNDQLTVKLADAPRELEFAPSLISLSSLWSRRSPSSTVKLTGLPARYLNAQLDIMLFPFKAQLTSAPMNSTDGVLLIDSFGIVNQFIASQLPPFQQLNFSLSLNGNLIPRASLRSPVYYHSWSAFAVTPSFGWKNQVNRIHIQLTGLPPIPETMKLVLLNSDDTSCSPVIFGSNGVYSDCRFGSAVTNASLEMQLMDDQLSKRSVTFSVYDPIAVILIEQPDYGNAILTFTSTTLQVTLNNNDRFQFNPMVIKSTLVVTGQPELQLDVNATTGCSTHQCNLLLTFPVLDQLTDFVDMKANTQFAFPLAATVTLLVPFKDVLTGDTRTVNLPMAVVLRDEPLRPTITAVNVPSLPRDVVMNITLKGKAFDFAKDCIIVFPLSGRNVTVPAFAPASNFLSAKERVCLFANIPPTETELMVQLTATKGVASDFFNVTVFDYAELIRVSPSTGLMKGSLVNVTVANFDLRLKSSTFSRIGAQLGGKPGICTLAAIDDGVKYSHPYKASVTLTCAVDPQEHGHVNVSLSYNQLHWMTLSSAYYIEPCQPGYGADDSLTCVLCPPGTFQPSNVRCLPCGKESWSNSTGATRCNSCPLHSTAKRVDSTSIYDCQCDIGYIVNPIADKLTSIEDITLHYCIPCPIGGHCNETNMAIPFALSGYWYSSENYTAFYACQPKEACPGGGFDSCQLGYEGAVCGRCTDAFFRWTGKCAPCTQDAWWRFLIAALTVLCLAILIYAFMSIRVTHLSSLSICLGFWQILCILNYIPNIEWPASVSTGVTLTSATNLNFDFISPKCFFPKIPFVVKWALSISLPLLLLVAAVLVYLTHLLRQCFAKRVGRHLSIKYRAYREDQEVIAMIEETKKQYSQNSSFASLLGSLPLDDSQLSPVTPSPLEPAPKKTKPSLSQRVAKHFNKSLRAFVNLVIFVYNTVIFFLTQELDAMQMEVFKNRLINAYCTFISFGFSYMVTTTSEVFACQPQPNGRKTMRASPDISCSFDNGQWAIMAPLAIVFYVVLLSSITLFFVISFFKREKLLERKSALRQRFRFVLTKFKTKFYFWDFVVALRKAMIAVCYMVFEPMLVLVTVIGISFIGFILHGLTAPYKKKFHNVMEYLSLMSTVVILFLGLLFFANYFPTPGLKLFITILTITIMAASTVVMVGLTIYDISVRKAKDSAIKKSQKSKLKKLLRSAKVNLSNDRAVKELEKQLIKTKYDEHGNVTFQLSVYTIDSEDDKEYDDEDNHGLNDIFSELLSLKRLKKSVRKLTAKLKKQ